MPPHDTAPDDDETRKLTPAVQTKADASALEDDITRLAESLARQAADEAETRLATANPPATDLPTARQREHYTASVMSESGLAETAAGLLDSLTGRGITASAALGADQELRVGVMLKNRFVLEQQLGRGGMGTVFRALDLRKVEAKDRDSFVALKVLNLDFRDNPMSLMALQRETKRAQTLSHPNIITVYDFDRDGPHVFMTMEYLQGRPLSQCIRELPPGGMAFNKAWPIVEGMCAALAYAHKKNIVHSDFKPGNVFITQQNEAKVLDFGIATAIGRPDAGNADATLFNARELGAMTPAYASLEQLQDREPDPRDDIYALACVCYELLSGQHPFGKLPADKAMELNIAPKPIPGLTRQQWKALQHGLAFRQEDRCKSVAELQSLLQPHGKWYYLAWLAGVLLAVVTGVNVYLNLLAPPVGPPPVTRELSQAERDKIKDLLELADIHFDVGYWTAPSGSNALWAYREALKIDPYNSDAIAGLKKIADALEQKAWVAYEKGDKGEALQKVIDGLEAEPKHEGLLKLKEKLQR